MPFDPDKPYNDLPLLPPKAELETKRCLERQSPPTKRLRSGAYCPESSGDRKVIRAKSVFLDMFLGYVQAWTYPCQNSYGFR